MDLNKLLVVMAVLLSASAAGQDKGSTLRAELTARYADMKLAMANKNESAIRPLLADGFVSVDASGNHEATSDMIKEVLALPPDPTRQSQTTILSLSRAGDVVIVEQRYDMTKKAKAADGTEKSLALSALVLHKVNPTPK
jgi:hypothetical protein